MTPGEWRRHFRSPEGSKHLVIVFKRKPEPRDHD